MVKTSWKHFSSNTPSATLHLKQPYPKFAVGRVERVKRCDVPIRRDAPLVDVCFAVCTALNDVGTVAVLTGGSAATYYAPTAYQSRDADFIVVFASNGRVGADALHRLGYSQVGGTYAHKESSYTLDFPPGPLAVGTDLIDSYETVRRSSEVLFVLSRTDCVRDRLASFYFFKDFSALVAAIAVAKSGDIDLAAVEAWSARENESLNFAEFKNRL